MGPKAPQATLQAINKFLKSTQIDTQYLRKTLIACSELEYAYKLSSTPGYTNLNTQHDPQQAQKILNLVLQKYKETNNAQITNQTLLEYFTSEFPPSTYGSLQVLKAFNSKSAFNYVPERIAMIPFRRAIYRADFRGALDVMENTCGELSNHNQRMNTRLKKIGGVWATTLATSLFGVHSVLMSGAVGEWDGGTAAMVCGMFGTYLSALSLYGAMATAGSKSGLGSVLEWVPGTSPLFRFKNSEQLRMATFATEINKSLPENLGECSPQLIQDLSKINLKPVETNQEQYLKEYWARGGDGFEWSEPDQDPADLLFREHMESTKQKRLNSAYSRKDTEGKLLSWESEVKKMKDGRSIPHASLLNVNELRSEEGMKTFEQELAEDMKQLKSRRENKKLPPSSEDNDDNKKLN